MSVRFAHASISENGTIRGKAGDQNGKEVCIRNWYKHSKGWVLIRCKDPKMRPYIAEAGERAAKNDNIGYDQIENQTLWEDVEKKGFDPAKADEPTETDCARLVRVCCQYACEQVGNGEDIPDFYTATEATVLRRTGLFEILTSSKYTTKPDYLQRGDILVTKTKGHTVIVLDDGDKAEKTPEPEKDYALGERILKNGMEGTDVKELQNYLNQLGYDCGGADGEFGDNTEQGLEEFQKDHGCEVDGEYGPESHKALMKALEDKDIKEPRSVRIVNGNCYVRSAPNTDGKKLGVARKGESYPYGGETSEDGWNLIDFNNRNGWVSGKYSEVEE